MKIQVASAITGILLCACTVTTLVPGAAQINVTDKPADVEHCHPLGSVQLVDKRNFPSSAETDQMRNQAVALGADTLLVTSTLFSQHASGVAYRCKETTASSGP